MYPAYFTLQKILKWRFNLLYKTTLLKGRAEVSMSQTLLLPAYCALLFHFLILGEKITKVRKGKLISRGLFIFFCNRHYSLLSFGGPQLYNSEALQFTYGQY